MAILRMKRIMVIGESKGKSALLAALMKFGCVELSEIQPSEDDGVMLNSDQSSPERLQKLQERFNTAYSLLKQYMKAEKAPLFAPRRAVSESDIFSTKAIEETAGKASEIINLGEIIDDCFVEINRLNAKRASVIPWKDLDIPFNAEEGSKFGILFGTSPSAADMGQLAERLMADAPECSLYVVSSDKEQHYLCIIYHNSASEPMLAALRDFGFSRLDMKEFTGTAAENITAVEQDIASAEKKRESAIAEVDSHKKDFQPIEESIDAVTMLSEREAMRDRLILTGTAFYAEGWVPEVYSGRVMEYLEKNGYAYAFEDPQEGEEVPICYKNGKYAEPYEMIVNLYGTPSYEDGRGIDATVFMAPFFAIFFGMMLSDAVYGIVLMVASLFALKKMKPARGTSVQRILYMGVMCGISTLFWGAMFGSWCGNAVSVISSTFFGGNAVLKPLWFDPLLEPMTLLIFSFALGFIHLFVGMGLAALRRIRAGHIWDAVFDIGFWYVLLISIVLLIIGVSGAKYGAIAGAAGIILTAGRDKKGIVGKLIGGLGSLYGISGYLSDVLSYSRLLALGLSTGVVATVINKMGVMGGNGIIGTILFIAVFIFGHIFNIAINLLGAYVHSSRLQYVEFFNKFFEGGGKQFLPLRYRPRYVDIIKEEI